MWEPNADLDAAATLGDALRAVGYTTEAIEELLGDDGPSVDRDETAVSERRLPHSPIANTIRLFLLQRPVAFTDARAALGGDGVDAVLRIGLATEQGNLLVPRARVVPTEGLLLAFDSFSLGEDDPPGWVGSFSPTAYWLAALTPRRHVERALDIGTGNGAHALLARQSTPTMSSPRTSTRARSPSPPSAPR